MTTLAPPSAFRHVDYLWDDAHAAQLGHDDVALLLYRSNLLGRDLRITNFGGGNTSVKTTDTDPLTGQPTEVMWVKGSGGDIGTLTRRGLAGLYMDRLHALKNRYRGLQFEDEIVDLYGYCLFDLHSAAPSIDTPLHAFVPYKHVDHLHPDAIIALAASRDAERLTAEVFEGKFAYLPWQRPGFDLGLKIGEAIAAHPGCEGVMLGGHGFFTWGDTAYESYVNSLRFIEKAATFLEENYGKRRPVFGGENPTPANPTPNPSPEGRGAAPTPSLLGGPTGRRAGVGSVGVGLFPHLRGRASQYRPMVGHFTDSPAVLEFVNSADLGKLAPMGTSCPDHFLRTKIRPLVLDPARLEGDFTTYLDEAFATYRAEYAAYYERCKHENSPAMRDPNPVVVLLPGVGMFTFAKDKQTARVAAEFYQNAINVMRGAEAVSDYVALPEQEAFNIEYWLLEEAKLQRQPKPKALSGKVALVTGGTGGIGRAVAEELLAHGACVVLADRDLLDETKADLGKQFGKDNVAATAIDVTSADAVAGALRSATLAFGGVDVVVNCAGISISKPLAETTEEDWNRLQDILVKGQFLVTQEAVAVMRAQKTGGDVVNIVSKNALFAGPNNVGYGTAKAAQLHMSRLLAAELGPDKIRVNVVNPDAVLRNSKIWAGDWAEGRAKAYGIAVEDLPAHYAKRTLLNEEILPEDIARAVRVFVDGSLVKSTGNVLNVDGGVAAAFVR